jgi:DNA-binding NarL/FixJ family response regulator
MCQTGGLRSRCDKISIVVVDDHTLFREGLREILTLESDFEVVGQAGDGEEGVRVVARCQPDVLLLDVEIPRHQVRPTLPQFLRASPHTRIVVLTMYDDPRLAHQLIDLGATACLVKRATRAELVAVIRDVCADERHVVGSIPRRDYRPAGDDQVPSLTRRQTEILRLAAQGLSNTQIASRLYISDSTVKRHLTKIYAQLGAVSRVDAINKARAVALIPAVDVGWDDAG